MFARFIKMIIRQLENEIKKNFEDNKVIVLLGARQVGKTSLLAKLTEDKSKVLWLYGDDTDTREYFANPNATKIKNLIGNNKILVIDEAQRIENIGLCLKIIYDQIKDVKVLATGSSAFELANKINEPLTGRKWEYRMFPLSFSEMANHTSILEENRLLEHRLVYGYYPDVINHPNKAEDILKQLANSYLYKDILTWERIQKPDRMEKLVQAIAFQVGNLVSYNELGNMSGLDNQTVEHYINLLEKAFIVFRLGAYSRNLRNELKKSRKIYFYDNGLRNAIINQFNPIGLRNDVGALWENFMIVERMKRNAYSNYHTNIYFWRNNNQQEIDYVEENNGKLDAFEFKWSPSKVKFPNDFVNTYNPAEKLVVTKENYRDFIC
ncbi:MAG: ATP-binding protein [Brumimicrobium sp.]|nr:ATP-binding protein [Brumimicrobium sp.]